MYGASSEAIAITSHEWLEFTAIFCFWSTMQNEITIYRPTKINYIRVNFFKIISSAESVDFALIVPLVKINYLFKSSFV